MQVSTKLLTARVFQRHFFFLRIEQIHDNRFENQYLSLSRLDFKLIFFILNLLEHKNIITVWFTIEGRVFVRVRDSTTFDVEIELCAIFEASIQSRNRVGKICDARFQVESEHEGFSSAGISVNIGVSCLIMRYSVLPLTLVSDLSLFGTRKIIKKNIKHLFFQNFVVVF